MDIDDPASNPQGDMLDLPGSDSGAQNGREETIASMFTGLDLENMQQRCQLQVLLLQLRNAIMLNAVDHMDIDDLCEALADEDFWEEVKGYFPILNGTASMGERWLSPHPAADSMAHSQYEYGLSPYDKATCNRSALPDMDIPRSQTYFPTPIHVCIYLIFRYAGETDCEIDSENETIIRMCEAASAFIPPPTISGQSPISEDYAAVLARVFFQTLQSFVFNENKMPGDLRVRLAMAFEPLSEIVGSAHHDQLIEIIEGGGGKKYGGYWRPPGQTGKKGGSSRQYHAGAQPQRDNITTSTGVFNRGNTCYQNVAWRLILSSQRAIENLASLTADDFPKGELDPQYHIYNLFQLIPVGAFDESRKSLIRLHELYQNKRSVWAPGPQQDMTEFLGEEILGGGNMGTALEPAFRHTTVTEVSGRDGRSVLRY